MNRHLVSLAPAEELAEFLLARGHCRVDNGQIALAAHCYENAYLFDSVRPGSREWFLEAAVESGYRPATPALARMLDDRKRRIAAARSGRPDPRAMPRPGGMAVRGDVYRPPAYGASPWPGIPQPQAFQVLQPRLPGPYVPPGPAQPPRP